MHKVDPIEIMLSDIFDKVFYKMNPNATFVMVMVRWRSKSSCLRILTET
jgi:hypothetical protein